MTVLIEDKEQADGQRQLDQNPIRVAWLQVRSRPAWVAFDRISPLLTKYGSPPFTRRHGTFNQGQENSNLSPPPNSTDSLAFPGLARWLGSRVFCYPDYQFRRISITPASGSRLVWGILIRRRVFCSCFSSSYCAHIFEPHQGSVWCVPIIPDRNR